MKTVCYISHVPFWHKANGGFLRDFQLLEFLSKVFKVKVVFLGKLEARDVMAIMALGLEYDINGIGPGGVLSDAEWQEHFLKQSTDVTAADVYIIRGIENHRIVDALPESVPRFLDTMDIISERSKKRSDKDNILSKMSREEELAIFRRYHQIICIQQDETDLVSQWLGPEHVVTAKHPVSPREFVPDRNRLRIGLIASHWAPNAYGLRDFIINCWPTVRRTGATLDVYGSVCDVLNAEVPAVSFHGFVEDIEQCYADLGMIINPVTYGAGLKIKSIEAMAYGIPLVTTREGASGIEKLDGHALLIGDSWEEITAHILSLQSDEERCVELSKNALVCIRDNFSEEACFSELQQRIENC